MRKIIILNVFVFLLIGKCNSAISSRIEPATKNLVTQYLIVFQPANSEIECSRIAYKTTFNTDDLPIAANADINNAIKNGSASSLASFFNSAVEISLPENEGTYSKGQAQMILSTFFGKNRPKSFVVVQEGASANNSNFVIGTYITTNNKNYRVYYVTKKVNGIDLIQHIEFDLK